MVFVLRKKQQFTSVHLGITKLQPLDPGLKFSVEIIFLPAYGFVHFKIMVPTVIEIKRKQNFWGGFPLGQLKSLMQLLALLKMSCFSTSCLIVTYSISWCISSSSGSLWFAHLKKDLFLRAKQSGYQSQKAIKTKVTELLVFCCIRFLVPIKPFKLSSLLWLWKNS